MIDKRSLTILKTYTIVLCSSKFCANCGGLKYSEMLHNDEHTSRKREGNSVIICNGTLKYKYIKADLLNCKKYFLNDDTKN